AALGGGRLHHLGVHQQPRCGVFAHEGSVVHRCTPFGEICFPRALFLVTIWGMIRTIAARLVLGLGTFLAVSMLVFLGMDALVGDAATAALGRDATPEAVAVLRKQFGLNRPVAERYTEWIAGLPRGDLGKPLP